MGLLKVAKEHAVLTVVAAGFVLGGTVTTAAIAVIPAAAGDEVFDLPATTPETVAPTEAPDPVAVAPTTEAPVPPPVEPPPANVEPVTEPAQDAAPAVAVEPDNQGIGTVGEDGRYTPAPPRINPGEPPLADNWNQQPEPAAPLPGEPGYVPPAPAG